MIRLSALVLALNTSLVFSAANNLVSDEWFEREVTLTQFLAFMSRFDGSLTIHNQVKLYQAAKKYRINPVFSAAIAQVESGAVCRKISLYGLDRIMGYGIMNPDNIGFDKQLERGNWLLRKHFDGFYPGAVVAYQKAPWDKTPQKYFKPENAATYARVVYCPVEADYVEHDKNGVPHKCGGNAAFEQVNNHFMEVFERMLEKKNGS